MRFLGGFRELLGNRNVGVVMIAQSLSTFVSWLWWPYKSLFIIELGASKELLGLLLTIETFSGLFFQFPGGVLADRFGRRRVMVFSALLGIGSPLIYLFATHWTHLLPALLLASVGSLSRPATNALVAESLPDDRRGSGFAALSLASRLTQVFTGFTGGVLMDTYGVVAGVRYVILGSLCVSLFTSLLFWIFIRETLVSAPVERSAEPRGLGRLRGLGSMPGRVWVLTAVAGLSAFATRMIFGFTVIYAVEVIGLSKTEYGAVSSLVSMVSLLLTLPGGLLADRFGKVALVAMSRVLSSLSKVGVPLSGGFIDLAAFRVVGAVGSGLGGTYMRVRGGPVWQALVADLTPADGRARMMGLMGTFVSFVSMPGSWAGGFLYARTPSYPFYVAFLMDTVGTVLLVTLLRRVRQGGVTSEAGCRAH